MLSLILYNKSNMYQNIIIFKEMLSSFRIHMKCLTDHVKKESDCYTFKLNKIQLYYSDDNDKHILENIGQWDFILLRLIPIRPITQVFKVSTHILTSITARYIGFSAILPIMSVSTFKTVVILYFQH